MFSCLDDTERNNLLILVEMEKIGRKKLVYALVVGVICFAVSFAVSFWISYKSAEKTTAEQVKQPEIHELVSQIQETLPMDMGNGIMWTNILYDSNTVIYDYIYTTLYASDIDQDMIDYAISTDKEQIIQTLTTGYVSNKDMKDWLDLLINNNCKLLYRYNDCDSQPIYTITILPSELEEALK